MHRPHHVGFPLRLACVARNGQHVAVDVIDQGGQVPIALKVFLADQWKPCAPAYIALIERDRWVSLIGSDEDDSLTVPTVDQSVAPVALNPIFRWMPNGIDIHIGVQHNDPAVTLDIGDGPSCHRIVLNRQLLVACL